MCFNFTYLFLYEKYIFQILDLSCDCFFELFQLVIAGAFYPHYYIRSAQNPNAEGEAVKSLAGHSPYNSVYIQNMPQPIPVYMEQLEQRLRDYNVAENFQIFHDSSRCELFSDNLTTIPL